MLEMPSQLSNLSSAPKAPAEEKCALQMREQDAATEKRAPIDTTLIKLNNFTQWAASGCVVPYLSVYFLHYTQGSRNDLGTLMMVASLAGVFVNFLFSSLADRYQAHRAIYLSTLTIANVSYLIMLIPILIAPSSGASVGLDSQLTDSDPRDILQGSEKANINATSGNASSTSQYNANDDLESRKPTRLTIDQQNAAWFYVIGTCVAIGNLSSGLNMTLSDSFAANAARSASHSEGPSFGSLRFFAALGWMAASASILVTNELQPDLAYLLPSWLLYLSLASANMMLVLFWPDKRPFDLGQDEATGSASKVAHAWPLERALSVKIAPSWPMSSWSKRWPTTLVRLEAHGTLADNHVSGISVLAGRVHEFDSCSFAGELLDHFPYGSQRDLKVRRCSIAPIGNSYICEQFVIRPPPAPPASASGRSSRATGAKGLAVEQLHHFKYITKIGPVNRMNLSELRAAEQEMGAAQRLAASEQRLERVSLKLYLKILELIARRNRNVLRFMLLYIVFGFTISLNWVFLFPYLEELDARKFKTLSAWVMMSSYFSETLLYSVSGRLTRFLSAANGLSFALFMFAARYACYLPFASGRWPLELIVLVEMMQSVSKGWFDCIYNESALEFALEAERCVPKLVELGLMPNTRPAVEKVRNSVKLTLFSLSSCCFDGIGIGLGSLLGGRLIHRHGFCSLWTTSVCLALTVCLLNVLLELSAFPAHSAPAALDKRAQTT